MGSYFHQDFFLVHGGVWEAVQAFIDDDPDDARLLPGEIATVLTHFPDEASLERYLDDLGCAYRAQAQDGGYRGWLTEIARRVEAATRR